MRLTGTYALTAAVNPAQRRIVGQIVPFGEQGTPSLAGEGIRLVVESGGLDWDDEQLPLLRATVHHSQVIGRAVTLDPGPAGIVGAFRVANTQAGDDALVLAAEGLQVGLSIEAEVPDGFIPDDDGVYRLTASNPARLTAVCLVERPAFGSAQVSEVAAAEVPDAVLTDVADQLRTAADTLTQNLPADTGEDNKEDTTMSDTTATTAAAVAASPPPPVAPPAVTAATTVNREPFPYGFDGAEGRSMFRDLIASQIDKDPDAGMRYRKAQTMLAEKAKATRRVRGRDLLAGDSDPELLTAAEVAMRRLVTAANEPVTRSTLVIPNVYDMEHYAAQLKFPRVIADQVPGVAIDNPRPRVVPTFTSAVADGGSGEPVVASTEGTNPAQAEINIGSATVTPVWYHGLYDISRQALDGGGPETDALCMGALYESYAQVTESAAVTAILANGTAGTDVTSNADTVDVEPRSALKSIRTQLATFYANRGAPADAVLYASDVYQAALGADGTDGRPLYSFLSDRYQVMNAAGSSGPAAMALDVYSVPGQLAFKLTAAKFVIAKWADMIRYESPLYEFRLMEPVAPASVRLAVGGYFAQRTLQAKGARYFTQL